MRAFPNIRKRRRVDAFTLIEILIAIGIFAMIMVAIFGSWTAILRSSRVGMAAAAEVQRTRVALRSLEESLGSAVMFVDNSRYYAFFTDTSGDNAFISFVARLPNSFPGSGMFHDQDVRRVTFFVENGQLMLSQSPIMEATHKIGKPYTIALAPGVTLFDMEFYDGMANKWFAEWISTNQLPKLVRVALSFAPKGQDFGPDKVTMRSIPLAGVGITRAGAGVMGGSGNFALGTRPPLGFRGRGAPGMAPPGVIGGGPDDLGFDPWQPFLPPEFRMNPEFGMRGRNPIFPPIPER